MEEYRITQAIDPAIELGQAADFIESNGFCFWGCHPNQNCSSNFVVFRLNTDTMPGSFSEGGYGVLVVDGFVDKTTANIDEISYSTPKAWLKSGEIERFTRFARVVEVVQTNIPVSSIISVNSGQLLRSNQLHPNSRILVNLELVDL